MIGERLESHANVPWGALLLVAVGLGLAAAGLVWGMSAMVIGAVLPLALGVTLWLLGQERPLSATVREEALEIDSAERPILIPYASIQNIRVGSRPADPAGFRRSSCAIAVLHAGGLLRIPSHLNFPSHELYRFLAGRIPDSGGRDVNPVLAEFLERQERYHGPENVKTFRAASRRVTGARLGYRAFCIGLMAAGAAWSAIGFSGYGGTEWGLVGIICFLTGAFLYGASFAEMTPVNPAMKNWKKASLVIAPQGMAMVQGEIQGEVHWPELLEVRFNAKPTGFTFGSHGAIPGILLRVKGANIVIPDIYDRPLFVIHRQILAASSRSTRPDHD